MDVNLFQVGSESAGGGSVLGVKVNWIWASQEDEMEGKGAQAKR